MSTDTKWTVGTGVTLLAAILAVFSIFGGRFDAMNGRLDAMDARLASIESRLLSIEEHLRAAPAPALPDTLH